MLDITYNDIKEYIQNDILYFTITNNGFILYTLNLLKSLARFDLDKKIVIVCFDSKADKTLRKMGYNTILFDINIHRFIGYNKEGYDKICYYKLLIIYKLLCLKINVFYIDADVVFLKNPEKIINTWNNLDKDMYIQNDSMDNSDDNNLCMGLLFVKSNSNTIKYFKCNSDENIKYYDTFCAFDNNDQSYFNNKIKPYLKVGVMKLEDCPNGKYFYKESLNIIDKVTVVHFNWVHGHEKLLKMKEYNMWLLTEDEEDI